MKTATNINFDDGDLLSTDKYIMIAAYLTQTEKMLSQNMPVLSRISAKQKISTQYLP